MQNNAELVCEPIPLVIYIPKTWTATAEWPLDCAQWWSYIALVTTSLGAQRAAAQLQTSLHVHCPQPKLFLVQIRLRRERCRSFQMRRSPAW